MTPLEEYLTLRQQVEVLLDRMDAIWRTLDDEARREMDGINDA